MGDTLSLTSTHASAKVLWVIAVAGKPVTVAEIASMMDDNANYDQLQVSLLRLYHSDLLVRRERTNTEPGRNPYEYELAPIDIGPATPLEDAHPEA